MYLNYKKTQFEKTKKVFCYKFKELKKYKFLFEGHIPFNLMN